MLANIANITFNGNGEGNGDTEIQEKVASEENIYST